MAPEMACMPCRMAAPSKAKEKAERAQILMDNERYPEAKACLDEIAALGVEG